MKLICGLGLFCLLIGCGGATRTTTLSMRGIDCASCAEPAVQRLRKAAGVEAVVFHRPEAELEIRHDPAQVDADKLARLAADASGREVRVGAGLGAYLPVEGWPAGADVQVLKGVDARLEPAAGKVTVFDFYALWCGPCRVVDEKLRALAAKHPDLAVRKLDMGDWDSAVAKKHMAGVVNLPYVQIYGRDGRRVAVIEGLDPARLEAVIEEEVAR
jgi:thiol-disulfide isomerase/thioredoxin